MLSKSRHQFDFAGFSFPKFVFTLPLGTFEKRIRAMKNPCTGGYYHAPVPNQRDGIGFYLGSDGMPGLRWFWCDDVASAQIDHAGWFCDDEQFEKIRGIVMRLPHGRGYLAGYSRGKNMASSIGVKIYDDIVDAAHAADSEAENADEFFKD
jgi:hypothetical protein